MSNPIELVLSTFVLLALLVVLFLEAMPPIKTHRRIPYLGWLFFLSVLVAAVALIWGQNLKQFIAIATFNWGGFLFGLLFTGLGIYLMVVTVRDNKPITAKALSYLALPAIVICMGLTVMVISFVS